MTSHEIIARRSDVRPSSFGSDRSDRMGADIERLGQLFVGSGSVVVDDQRVTREQAGGHRSVGVTVERVAAGCVVSEVGRVEASSWASDLVADLKSFWSRAVGVLGGDHMDTPHVTSNIDLAVATGCAERPDHAIIGLLDIPPFEFDQKVISGLSSFSSHKTRYYFRKRVT